MKGKRNLDKCKKGGKKLPHSSLQVLVWGHLRLNDVGPAFNLSKKWKLVEKTASCQVLATDDSLIRVGLGEYGRANLGNVVWISVKEV